MSVQELIPGVGWSESKVLFSITVISSFQGRSLLALSQ